MAPSLHHPQASEDDEERGSSEYHNASSRPTELHSGGADAGVCQSYGEFLRRDAERWQTDNPNARAFPISIRRNGIGISVADRGSGMDPSILPRQFQPFLGTKGEGGTGVGLLGKPRDFGQRQCDHSQPKSSNAR